MKILLGAGEGKPVSSQVKRVMELLGENDIEVESVLFQTTSNPIIFETNSETKRFRSGISYFDPSYFEKAVDIWLMPASQMLEPLPLGLEVISILKREDVREVIISPRKEADLENLSTEIVIATNSDLRKAYLHHFAPQVKVKLIPEPLENMFHGMESGDFDGILSGIAEVKQNGLTHLVVQKLNPVSFTPQGGQGAWAIVGRTGNCRQSDLRTVLNHPATENAVKCELAFERTIRKSSQEPVFALATVIGEIISLQAGVVEQDGKKVLRGTRDGFAGQPEKLGSELAKDLFNKEGGQS
ncbi:MAG: hypothetical protein H6581_05710 [Bacteroidia bacterium]|nr:hypothetical protein [Bacteroidia bacterium]